MKEASKILFVSLTRFSLGVFSEIVYWGFSRVKAICFPELKLVLEL